MIGPGSTQHSLTNSSPVSASCSLALATAERTTLSISTAARFLRGANGANRSPFRPIELRPYQQAAALAWATAGRRGVVVLPTGSGKTRVALAVVAVSAARA